MVIIINAVEFVFLWSTKILKDKYMVLFKEISTLKSHKKMTIKEKLFPSEQVRNGL